MFEENKEKAPETRISPDSTTSQTQEKSSFKKSDFVWETVKFAIFALIVVLPIRMYVAQPFIVSGSSMDPTFDNGHYLIVDQLSYRFEKPKRGEVIVFKYPNDPSKFFIKRIIGLPGEKVEIINGEVYIRGASETDSMKLSEPYIEASRQKYDNWNIPLGPDEYFVMGDNRIASSDSRVWGALEEKFIVGRALVRLLPITEASIFPGEAKY